MKPLVRHVLVPTLCTVGLLCAGLAHATIVKFHSDLNSSQEVPTNGSTATGDATTVVDTDANTLSYNVTYSGLTSAENNAHIHGPAARGVSAGVLFGLPAGSPKVGVWNYPESQEANILNGLTYYNIHTVNNGGGEIRGQIDHQAVPGVQPWQLAVLALALLTAGTAFVMRRRRMA